MSTAAAQSETEIMRAVLVAVTALPETMAWRNNTGVGVSQRGAVIRFSVPGAPDILGVRRGRGFGIEVKTPAGRLSQQQAHFRAAWERAGGLYIVARSVDDALAGLQVAP